MLPTFIVAGAAKSGTTAIWEYLRPHPEICMSWMKEPNFFTTSAKTSRNDKGLAWYESLFQPSNGVRAIGEVSPAYMLSEESPRLIHQTIPDAQILFVFRDPVERIYSQYRYALHRGVKLPGFEQLIQENHLYLQRAIYASSYNLHMDRFLELFPKEKVLVFLYDEWRQDPQDFMRRMYQAVGADPEFVAPNLGMRYNPTQRARLPWLQRSIGTTGQKVMLLTMPPWLFAMLRDVRRMLWRINSARTQPALLARDLRQRLIEEMMETIEYIEDYLGYPLPSWRQA